MRVASRAVHVRTTTIFRDECFTVWTGLRDTPLLFTIHELMEALIRLAIFLFPFLEFSAFFGLLLELLQSLGTHQTRMGRSNLFST